MHVRLLNENRFQELVQKLWNEIPTKLRESYDQSFTYTGYKDHYEVHVRLLLVLNEDDDR